MDRDSSDESTHDWGVTTSLVTLGIVGFSLSFSAISLSAAAAGMLTGAVYFPIFRTQPFEGVARGFWHSQDVPVLLLSLLACALVLAIGFELLWRITFTPALQSFIFGLALASAVVTVSSR
ncbi:hypothetical protein [Natronobiforma cellulositropha]|uniref:hypothetical protein n=1 Tax=Natronobiforma cellulositropha TaxID=1679076 RepID=UPI0021D5C0F0|nr:hypothetical protein [Natronobiforma cellulositropha]